MSQTITEETQRFLGDPEISIWIDKYDDVFSEFDSRPFSERALSDDFLREVRKMASEKTCKEIQLKFNILGAQREPESEKIIINNLNKHFKHIADALKKEQKDAMQRGYTLLGLGSLLILVLFYFNTLPEKYSYLHGINLMFEPVGWFMTWTGLDFVFQISKKSDATLDFNNRMADAQIAFSSLDEVQEAQAKTVIPLDNNNLRVA